MACMKTVGEKGNRDRKKRERERSEEKEMKRERNKISLGAHDVNEGKHAEDGGGGAGDVDLLSDGCLFPASLALPRTRLPDVVLQLARRMAAMRPRGGWSVAEESFGLFLCFRLIAVDLPVDEHFSRLGGQLFIPPGLQFILQLVAHIWHGDITDETLWAEADEK